jgi:hypothetical protein
MKFLDFRLSTFPSLKTIDLNLSQMKVLLKKYDYNIFFQSPTVLRMVSFPSLQSTFMFFSALQCLKNSRSLTTKVTVLKTKMQRLDRIISNRGIGARSDVAAMLRQGRVKVRGKVIRSGSIRYATDILIEVDGKNSLFFFSAILYFLSDQITTEVAGCENVKPMN